MKENRFIANNVNYLMTCVTISIKVFHASSTRRRVNLQKLRDTACNNCVINSQYLKLISLVDALLVWKKMSNKTVCISGHNHKRFTIQLRFDLSIFVWQSTFIGWVEYFIFMNGVGQIVWNSLKKVLANISRKKVYFW